MKYFVDRFLGSYMWYRRLRFALEWREWPWKLDARAVRWVSLDQRLTAADIRVGKEIAKRIPWR